MNTEKEDMVSNWIQENGNPAIEKLTSINQNTARKVGEVLKEKGIDADTFAQLVDTQVAEVSKWLAGHHNFSEKMLSEIIAKIEVN
jgi:DNA-binding transcriptional regulator YiaG